MIAAANDNRRGALRGAAEPPLHRIVLALAFMVPTRWLFELLSPVGAKGRNDLLPPFAHHRVGACLALHRLRCRVRAWAEGV